MDKILGDNEGRCSEIEKVNFRILNIFQKEDQVKIGEVGTIED